MGLLDKVGAGKLKEKFDDKMKGLAASLATRYGVVSAGKYDGCHVSLGYAPNNKVSKADPNAQTHIIFLKDSTEEARLEIATEVEWLVYKETIQFPATGADGYRCEMTFSNGDTCQIDLFPSQLRLFFLNTHMKMDVPTGEFFQNILLG